MSTTAFEVRGGGASAGTAAGALAVSAQSALQLALTTPVIFVCYDASVEDVQAIRASAGIITSRGGLTGDGAIVARALGIPCVIGISALRIDRATASVHFGASGEGFGEGSWVVIDGSTGLVCFPRAAST
jgi:pyruvate, orthophosphate dikinase